METHSSGNRVKRFADLDEQLSFPGIQTTREAAQAHRDCDPAEPQGSSEGPLDMSCRAQLCSACQLELFGRVVSEDEEVLVGPFGGHPR